MGDRSEKIAQLRALLNTPGVLAGSQFRAVTEERDAKRAAGEYEVRHVVPGEIVGEPDNGFYLVRQDFPLAWKHGCVALESALATDARHVATSANDDALAGFNPRKAVFVDTETTGLMGGSGTVAFLIGVGYFIENSFRLDQCFMRDYDDEGPMLAFLDGLFKNAETLVSFNGKTFDLPLLRTRFIQNRVPFRLDGAMHYDLVHAARRFWKKRLGDCSLGSVERNILGLQRHGDVAGAEIPVRWFNYLRSRDARPLTPVFYHHKMDILSLVSLTGLLSQKMSEPEGQGFEHHEDRLSLLRLQVKRKEWEQAAALAERLLEQLDDEKLMCQCLELAVLATKRTKEWERMETYSVRIIEQFPNHTLARIEYAKHLEHRRRNLPEAIRICREGLQIQNTRMALGYSPAILGLRDLESRMERMEKKLNKAMGKIDRDATPESQFDDESCLDELSDTPRLSSRRHRPND